MKIITAVLAMADKIEFVDNEYMELLNITFNQDLLGSNNLNTYCDKTVSFLNQVRNKLGENYKENISNIKECSNYNLEIDELKTQHIDGLVNKAISLKNQFDNLENQKIEITTLQEQVSKLKNFSALDDIVVIENSGSNGPLTLIKEKFSLNIEKLTEQTKTSSKDTIFYCQSNAAGKAAYYIFKNDQIRQISGNEGEKNLQELGLPQDQAKQLAEDLQAETKENPDSNDMNGKAEHKKWYEQQQIKQLQGSFSRINQKLKVQVTEALQSFNGVNKFNIVEEEKAQEIGNQLGKKLEQVKEIIDENEQALTTLQHDNNKAGNDAKVFAVKDGDFHNPNNNNDDPDNDNKDVGKPQSLNDNNTDSQQSSSKKKQVPLSDLSTAQLHNISNIVSQPNFSTLSSEQLESISDIIANKIFAIHQKKQQNIEVKFDDYQIKRKKGVKYILQYIFKYLLNLEIKKIAYGNTILGVVKEELKDNPSISSQDLLALIKSKDPETYAKVCKVLKSASNLDANDKNLNGTVKTLVEIIDLIQKSEVEETNLLLQKASIEKTTASDDNNNVQDIGLNNTTSNSVMYLDNPIIITEKNNNISDNRNSFYHDERLYRENFQEPVNNDNNGNGEEYNDNGANNNNGNPFN